MDLLEKRYKRHFENADYGWFLNCILDFITKVNGFSPSYIVSKNFQCVDFLKDNKNG